MPLYPPIEPYTHGMLDVGDGQRISFEECGNPDGRPAVVLHGGPGSGCTPFQRRFFNPARYRVVLFDQRGCGRSTPHAGDPRTSLEVNTTWHLLGDIERLREHLGIERWLVFGGSWGATLGLLYAETYPVRVSALVLGGVTTTRRREVDWLFRGGVAPLFPEQWAALLDGIPPPMDRSDPVEAYARLLEDSDAAIREQAALNWCRWESVSISATPGPPLAARFKDPAYRMAFARIVTHYFRHTAWLEEGQVLRDAGRLAGIPGAMVHGRLDLQAPLLTAWELSRAWPDGELVVVDNAGHASSEPGIPERLVEATDRFARI
ncbi:MAG: prolyl aminopeptidase [Dehalococcoidia bacterium]